jgi:hypothetical protein
LALPPLWRLYKRGTSRHPRQNGAEPYRVDPNQRGSMTDVVQIVGLVGTLIGSTAAAFISRRALSRSTESKQSSEKVQTEMLGEGDAPSLRQMLLDQRKVIDDHVAGVATEFEKMHRDSSAVIERIGKLEQAVFTSIEGRVAKLELVAFADSAVKRMRPKR